MLLKPNQRGTLSETLAAWRAAQSVGYAGIVSARSGETEDTTIVHLAIGWGSGQLKVGSFARGERMAKWNEALRIEERLGDRARFAGAGVFGRSRVGRGRAGLDDQPAAALACAARTSTRTCSVSSAFSSLNCGVVFTE